MKPTITITVSGPALPASRICDALHKLAGNPDSPNADSLAALFSRHEINTDVAPEEDAPAAPILVPLGPNNLRDGRKARVLCNDLAGQGKKVIAAIESRIHPDSEVTSFHYEDGRVNLNGTEDPGDLIGHLPPEPVKPREFWLNCYYNGGTSHPTRESADHGQGGERIECVHVREVLPGQDDELERLRGWKRQQMESTPDWQAIGKEMGLTIGQDVPSKVLSYIRILKAQLARSAQQ